MSRRMLRGAAIGTFSASLVILAFGLGFGSALLLRPPVLVPDGVRPPENFKIFSSVWGYIDREFYGGRPSASVITEHAVGGLVQALDDPVGYYLPKAEQEEDVDAVMGERWLNRWGIWAEPTFQGARVLSVLPGSAADDGGVIAGDIVLASAPLSESEATDLPAEGREVEAAAAEVLEGLIGPNGEDDDEVHILTVLEAATEPQQLIVLRRGRAAVTLEVAPEERTPATGDTLSRASFPPYVAMERSAEGTLVLRIVRVDAAAVEALDELLRPFDEPLDAVIVDLRDNPGGDVESAARMAGRFVDGIVWLESGRGAEVVERKAVLDSRANRLEAGRWIVLVNGGTVGEAEMLAAALAESGATLIGEPSFGRHTMAEVMPVGPTGLLRLSTAAWQTPGGVSVADGGLVPDREIEGRREQTEAARAAAGEAQAAGGSESGGG